MTRNFLKNCKEKFGKPNGVVRRSQFRSKYLGNQNRLLAFWDKSEPTDTLVLATHGFIKKYQKVPQKEIDKAERIRQEYFNRKKKK